VAEQQERRINSRPFPLPMSRYGTGQPISFTMSVL
jgi:hypothetical protein